jgi:hypothetical protein
MPDSNKNLVVSPRWCFIPRHTGRLTAGRNIRLDLTNSSVGRELLFRGALNPDAKAYPLLEAVTRQQQVKTLWAGKDSEL